MPSCSSIDSLVTPYVDGVLADALRRNVFGTAVETAKPSMRCLNALCDYMRQSDRALADIALEALRAGDISFPVPAYPGTA